MSITISFEQIENLITTIENTVPDYRTDFRKGDWVVLDNRASAWSDGHIAQITDNGRLVLDYGGKDLPQMFRLRGMGMPIHPSEVIEHWRQIDAVTRQTVGGMEVTEVGYKWVRVQ